MILRSRRRLGYGKFRSLVSITVLVLQVAVVGVADANNSKHGMLAEISAVDGGLLSGSAALQWYCQQLSEGNLDLESLSPILQHTLFDSKRKYNGRKYWGLCQLRGGHDASSDKLQSATAVSNKTDVDEDESTLLVMENTKEEPVEEANEEEPAIDYSSSPYAFSLFQEGDGSQTDPDGIPTRYLKMQNNRRPQAKAAVEATIKWRKENNINTILARPHPQYDVCKSVFPHFFCGRDESGHVILLQRPGMIDLQSAYANGLTGEALLNHYVYINEYLWQILEPRADETMTSIIDLQGISLSFLRKPDLLSVVQMFCSTMDAHFPQRANKTLLINAPKWFGAAYKLVSPLLRESTKSKIFILSKGKEQEEVLASVLTEQRGNFAEVEPAQMETDLRNFVIDRLKESNVEMQQVV